MNKNIKIVRISPTSCLVYTRFLALKGNPLQNKKFGELALIEDNSLYLGELQTELFPSSLSATTNERNLFQYTDKMVSQAKISREEENDQIRIATISKGDMEILKCRLLLQIGRDHNKYLFDQHNQYIRQQKLCVNSLKTEQKAELAASEQNLLKLQKQQFQCSEQKRKTLIKISRLYIQKRNKILELHDKAPDIGKLYIPKVKNQPNEIDDNFGATFFMQSQNFR